MFEKIIDKKKRYKIIEEGKYRRIEKEEGEEDLKEKEYLMKNKRM